MEAFLEHIICAWAEMGWSWNFWGFRELRKPRLREARFASAALSTASLDPPFAVQPRRNTQAIIYVVDSCDAERLPTSREEFQAILSEDELRTAAVLVFANKQDLPGALSEAQVAEGLGLSGIKTRPWSIFKTSAVKGEGLFEGLDWLSATLKSRK